MKKKPIIGIPASYKKAGITAPEGGAHMIENDWSLVQGNYVRAVERFGGAPLVIPVLEDESSAEVIVTMLDGILFTGGADIAAWRYGEYVEYGHGMIDQIRDEQEFMLIKMAMDRELPIFGVCRGLQLINIAFGGTLYQDIIQMSDKFFIAHSLPGPMDRCTIIHSVGTVPGTKLREVTGMERIEVNSFHHQAIDKLANSLVASAVAPDGCIEAVESTGNHFVMGVQWHAEGLCDTHKPSADLLTYFIEECRTR